MVEVDLATDVRHVLQADVAQVGRGREAVAAHGTVDAPILVVPVAEIVQIDGEAATVVAQLLEVVQVGVVHAPPAIVGAVGEDPARRAEGCVGEGGAVDVRVIIVAQDARIEGADLRLVGEVVVEAGVQGYVVGLLFRADVAGPRLAGVEDLRLGRFAAVPLVSVYGEHHGEPVLAIGKRVAEPVRGVGALAIGSADLVAPGVALGRLQPDVDQAAVALRIVAGGRGGNDLDLLDVLRGDGAQVVHQVGAGELHGAVVDEDGHLLLTDDGYSRLLHVQPWRDAQRVEGVADGGRGRAVDVEHKAIDLLPDQWALRLDDHFRQLVLRHLQPDDAQVCLRYIVDALRPVAHEADFDIERRGCLHRQREDAIVGGEGARDGLVVGRLSGDDVSIGDGLSVGHVHHAAGEGLGRQKGDACQRENQCKEVLLHIHIRIDAYI